MSKQVGSDDLVLVMAHCNKDGCPHEQCGQLIVGITSRGTPEPMLATFECDAGRRRIREAARIAATGTRMPISIVHYRRVAVVEVVEPMAGGQG